MRPNRLSQAAQSKGSQGRGSPVYGRGPPGQQRGGNDRPRRPRREPVEEVWIPKTILGQKGCVRRNFFA